MRGGMVGDIERRPVSTSSQNCFWRTVNLFLGLDNISGSLFIELLIHVDDDIQGKGGE